MQMVHSLEGLFEAASGGFEPVDNACLLPCQRAEIFAACKVSVAVRQRGGWTCRQLTMTGDEADQDVDFSRAKALAIDAIGENYDAGIRSLADIPADHRQHMHQQRQEGQQQQQHQEGQRGAGHQQQQEGQRGMQGRAGQHRQQSKHEDRKPDGELMAALQVAHANQMSCEGLPFTMQCNTIQHSSIQYNEQLEKNTTKCMNSIALCCIVCCQMYRIVL